MSYPLASLGPSGPIEVYPNRDVMHRWMGPPGCCEKCGGRGWYPDEESPRERYCDCPCGNERRRVDGC